MLPLIPPTRCPSRAAPQSDCLPSVVVTAGAARLSADTSISSQLMKSSESPDTVNARIGRAASGPVYVPRNGKDDIMAKNGKKGIGKIVLIVLAVLVVIGVAGTALGGNSDSADAPDTAGQTQTQQAEEQEPYTITDEVMDTSNGFAVYIDGTLTNNTDDEVSYIQVEYNLYDADGAQVGTALANTNNLQPGGVWKFEALGTASPDEVASYELIDVTGF